MQRITRVCKKCSKNGELRNFRKITEEQNVDGSKDCLYECEKCGNQISQKF
jgi:uncharacterized Zn finger protein